MPQSSSVQSPAATKQNSADSRRSCPHLPLSWMTTPKCVLGVLSSGTLGGTEMTGGLDGFLLEVILFSERRKKKKKAGNKKTRPNRSSGLSVPPKVHGTASDVGFGIWSFLLVSGRVQVLTGLVSDSTWQFCSYAWLHCCIDECVKWMCCQCNTFQEQNRLIKLMLIALIDSKVKIIERFVVYIFLNGVMCLV